MRDSCGSSGTGETPQAFTPRRLTARPAESDHLEGKSTTPHYLVNSNKVSGNGNSLFIKTYFLLLFILMNGRHDPLNPLIEGFSKDS